MPPLITPDEALELGALTEPKDIEALVERAWEAREERFGDCTDMCSLVNAKSGGCAEDCGFCAQSRFAEAETPMHAMMEPEQILEHARAAEAAGAHRFCMVTQGQGLSKRDFEKVLEGARLVAEHTNLKRCASIGHMSVARAKALKEAGIQRVHHNVETAESYYPEVSTTVRYEGRLRTIDAVTRGRPRDLRRRHPQPRRDRASSASRWRSSSRGSTRRACRSTCSTRGRDEVRRPRLHGSVGGREVDRDLPADPARRAVPALRRARREPRRAAAAGRQGRHQRRDDGQLPDDARQHARARTARCSRTSASTSPASPTTAPTRAPTTAPAGSTARRPDVVEEFLDDARRRAASIDDPALGPGRAAALRQEEDRSRRGRTARRTAGRGAAAGTAARRPEARRDDIQARLDELRDLGLYRRMRLVSGPQGPRVVLDGKPVLLLCSNNYLGLADHPRVREAAADAAMRWGVGAGASRLVSRDDDDPPPARGARSRRSRAREARAAVRLGLPGQRRRRHRRWRASGDVVFSDELNHASIIDGCRLVARRDVRLPPLRRRAPRLGAASEAVRPRRADRDRLASSRWTATSRRWPRSSSSRGATTCGWSSTRRTAPAASARAAAARSPRPGSSTRSTSSSARSARRSAPTARSRLRRRRWRGT